MLVNSQSKLRVVNTANAVLFVFLLAGCATMPTAAPPGGVVGQPHYRTRVAPPTTAPPTMTVPDAGPTFGQPETDQTFESDTYESDMFDNRTFETDSFGTDDRSFETNRIVSPENRAGGNSQFGLPKLNIESIPVPRVPGAESESSNRIDSQNLFDEKPGDSRFGGDGFEEDDFFSSDERTSDQARPEFDLSVRAPRSRFLGEPTTFAISVENSGEGQADDVVVVAEFDDSLYFAHSERRRVRQSLGRMDGRSTREITLSLTSDSEGHHACRFSIVHGGSVVLEKEVVVAYRREMLAVDVVGPTQRTVGSKAEFTVRIVNRGFDPIAGGWANIHYDGALKPLEASAGVEIEPSQLRWALDAIAPGEGIQIQVEFECVLDTAESCLMVDVGGADYPSVHREACLAIERPFGLLAIEARDLRDSIYVGEENEYEVIVTNRDTDTIDGIRIAVEIPTGCELLWATISQDDRQIAQVTPAEDGIIVFDRYNDVPAGGQLVYVVRVRAVRAGDGWFRAMAVHSGLRTPVETREPTIVIGE